MFEVLDQFCSMNHHLRKYQQPQHITAEKIDPMINIDLNYKVNRLLQLDEVNMDLHILVFDQNHHLDHQHLDQNGVTGLMHLIGTLTD